MNRDAAAELRFGPLEALAVARGQVQAAALGGERLGRRQADALGAARDQNRLALQPQIHDVPRGSFDATHIIGARRNHPMKAIRNLALACAVALAAAPALAQSVKIKQGMLNVPALSPLWLLPDEAKKQGIEIEMVMFQRFADARTALASGDIQITAFGPQDISLALGAGAKSLVGVAGVGSGND